MIARDGCPRASLKHWLPCLLALVLAPGAARAALPTDFADQLVVGGLNRPVAFAFLPDGRMLINEQATHLVRLAVNGVPTTILDVPEVSASGGERGLLGIAIDPQWPARPYVYLMHSRTPGNVSYLVRYRAGGDLSNPASTNLTLTRRLVLLADIPDSSPNHNGGTLQFGPDGMLYASLGDDEDPCGAQDLSLLKGCILRLKVNDLTDTFGITVPKASITPPDNPWVGMGNENARLHFAKGLRNPFSFSIDTVDGRLYIADVGPTTYEEVDEASGGENFGWPQYEGPDAYAGYPGGCPATTPLPPVVFYDRSAQFNAAIIGVPIYHPVLGGAYSFPAEYDGNGFFGQYYEGWIRRMYRGPGNVWQAAPVVAGQPNAVDWGTSSLSVSSYQVGPDGALYYCKQFGAPSIRRIIYSGSASSVADDRAEPPRPALLARPNPLLPGVDNVTLSFTMSEPGSIALELFDIAGRQVRTLRQGHVDAGPTETRWDLKDDEGHSVANGVYFARLSGAGDVRVARMVVLRR